MMSDYLRFIPVNPTTKRRCNVKPFCLFHVPKMRYSFFDLLLI